MKKVISFLIMVAIFMVTLASCQTQNTKTEKSVKVTTKEMGTEGFLIKKVAKGDTVWGYSQETYGTGMQWREIVIENPFLNEPGRIYYDQEREKWIVLIYPGETVKIRGQIVNPTFVSEEVTITTTTETAGLPWWAWIIIPLAVIAFIFILVGVIGLFTSIRNKPCCESYQQCRPCGYPTVNYRSGANGEISVCSQGASEFSFNRGANGETSFTVRR